MDSSDPQRSAREMQMYLEQLETLGHWEGRLFRFSEMQLVNGCEVDKVDCTQAEHEDGEPVSMEDCARAVLTLLGYGPPVMHDKVHDEDGVQCYTARPPEPGDN